MEEIQLVYGLKNEELTHIDKVESGEKCGCICPACKGTLIARKGAVKRHHFADRTIWQKKIVVMRTKRPSIFWQKND